MPPEPKLIARAVKPYEVEAHFHVMCESFGLDPDFARPIYFGDPFFDISYKRILFDGNSAEPIAGLTVVPTKMRLPGGATLNVAGLAGVGTVPPRRNQGVASALLTTTLHDLADELDYPMAALVTDRPAFYRQFGWETCSTVVRWSGGPCALPRHEAGLSVTLLSPDEGSSRRAELNAVLEAANRGIAGSFVRDSRRWDCIEKLSVGRQIAVWQPRGRIEAYIAFDTTETGESTAIEIHEMVAVNQVGHKALIGYLASREDASCVSGRMNATGIKKFGLDKVTGLTRIDEEGVLLRIVSLEDCLTAAAQMGVYTRVLVAAPNGLTIRVDNSTLPHHNKPMRLFGVIDDSGRGHTALAPADELEDHWIAGPIGALTQMFVGYKTPDDLHGAGCLRTSSDEAIALATQLFPKTDPFLAPADTF